MTFSSDSFGASPFGAGGDDVPPPLQVAVAFTESDDTVAIQATPVTAGVVDANIWFIEDNDTVAAAGLITSAALMVIRMRDVGTYYDQYTIWLDDPFTNVNVSVTEAGDTVAATAMVVSSSSVSVAEGDDTVAVSASVISASTITVQEDDDTVSIAGEIVTQVSLATIDEDDVVAASASVNTYISVAFTEADDTVTGSATVNTYVAVATLDADDTVVASASVVATISVATLDADDTVVASTTTYTFIDVAVQEQDDTVAIVETTGSPTNIVVQDDDDTVAATAMVSAVVNAAMTDDNDVVTVSTSVLATMFVTVQDQDDAVVITLAAQHDVNVAVDDDDDVVSATAAISTFIDVAVDEDDDIVNGSATVFTFVNVAVDEGNDIVAASAYVATDIQVDVLEDDDTVEITLDAEAEVYVDVQEEGDLVAITGLIVFVDSPTLSVRSRADRIDLTWSLSSLVQAQGFEVYRSLVAPPQQPAQGQLIYAGTGYDFIDQDVQSGVRYFYTVFAVLDDSPRKITPFAVKSTGSAVLRVVLDAGVVTEEYTPVRGEFGVTLATPFAFLGTSAAWGDIEPGKGIRRSDVLRGATGTRIVSPVPGTVRIEDDVIVVTSDVGGFRFRMTGVKPSVKSDARVKVGESLGVMTRSTLVFELFKLPTGKYGLRTVRPARFWLELDLRTGRGRSS